MSSGVVATAETRAQAVCGTGVTGALPTTQQHTLQVS